MTLPPCFRGPCRLAACLTLGVLAPACSGSGEQVDAGSPGDTVSGGGGGGGGGGATVSYDQTVLADAPVAYWAMTRTATATEADLTGYGNTGSYRGGTPAVTTAPNGDPVAVFNGTSQYLTVPSKAS